MEQKAMGGGWGNLTRGESVLPAVTAGCSEAGSAAVSEEEAAAAACELEAEFSSEAPAALDWSACPEGAGVGVVCVVWG